MGNREVVRAQIEAAEKRLRSIVERNFELSRFRKNEDCERIPLEKPVFWGYRRRLILRKDAAKRKDAKRLLELLPIVQKEEDCKRKDFRQWDKKLRRWIEWNHTPRTLSVWERKKVPDDLQCYFELYQHDSNCCRYRIRTPNFFESRRSKLYFTHRFLPNVDRERELSFLDAKMEQGQLWNAYRKIKSSKATWKTWTKELPLQKQLCKSHRQEVGIALELQAAGLLGLEQGKEVICDAKEKI